MCYPCGGHAREYYLLAKVTTHHHPSHGLHKATSLISRRASVAPRSVTSTVHVSFQTQGGCAAWRTQGCCRPGRCRLGELSWSRAAFLCVNVMPAHVLVDWHSVRKRGPGLEWQDRTTLRCPRRTGEGEASPRLELARGVGREANPSLVAGCDGGAPAELYVGIPGLE